MNLWKAILATLVIFVAGVVTGGLLVNYSDRTWQKSRRISPREAARLGVNPNLPAVAGFPSNPRDLQRQPNLPGRATPGLNLEFVQKLDSEVHLTSEQRERIQKIIADGQQRNKELWKRIAPELREENLHTKDRIREALTPEQRARFDELMKQNQPGARPHRQPAPRDTNDPSQSAPQGNP